MTVSFDLPQEVERELHESFDDLGQAAKEALAIRGYSERKCGLSTVRRLLGFETQWEAQEWLPTHQVPINYSVEDLEKDPKAFREGFGSNS